MLTLRSSLHPRCQSPSRNVSLACCSRLRIQLAVMPSSHTPKTLHDVNNSLTVVIANVDYARERLAALQRRAGNLGAELAELLSVLEEAADAARTSIGTLSTWTPKVNPSTANRSTQIVTVPSDHHPRTSASSSTLALTR